MEPADLFIFSGCAAFKGIACYWGTFHRLDHHMVLRPMHVIHRNFRKERSEQFKRLIMEWISLVLSIHKRRKSNDKME